MLKKQRPSPEIPIGDLARKSIRTVRGHHKRENISALTFLLRSVSAALGKSANWDWQGTNSVDSQARLPFNGYMPKRRKNPAAVLLGKMSGIARSQKPVRQEMAEKKMVHSAAVALGRLGGSKGGRAGGLSRAKALSAAARRTIAIRAIKARWAARKGGIAGI